jgi:hypothetical protein
MNITGYIVTLLPGSGIGSAILGILGGLLYLKKNNIQTILYVNQYHASVPVNCFIDYFLDKENITLLKFIRKDREYKNNDEYKELFFVKETEKIYHEIRQPMYFNDIVLLFNNIFILKEKLIEEYNNLTKYDISINIRRGDKITLESHIPVAKIETYIENIEKLNLNSPTICHTSDEYGTFLEIKQARPEWNINTLTHPEETGYFLSILNSKPVIELYSHVDKFMKQLFIIKNSKYFIGTESTSVGFLVKLLRNVNKNNSNIYI